MKVFPTCLFAPNNVQVDLDRRTISGGAALSGDEDVVAADGGGRVFVEFGEPYLDDPTVAKAWRALDAFMDGGARPIIVPFCDGRHQPIGGIINTTHSDNTTFSDEAEYAQSGATGLIAAPAALRATTVQLSGLVLSEPLTGGEWLSIDHPTMRWRAYRIAEIFSQDDTTATVAIRPPLRESVTAGEAVEFSDPRCTMRLEGSMPSPTSLGYVDAPPIRFVEDFTGVYV